MHVPLLSHWQRGKTAVIVAPTQANRVVRHDVDDTSLRQRRHTHGTAHVVSEDEEGRAVGDEAAVVQRNAVADGSHAVLAHTEAQVALSVLAWRGRVKLCGREGDGGKEKTAVDRVSACACNSKANKIINSRVVQHAHGLKLYSITVAHPPGSLQRSSSASG